MDAVGFARAVEIGYEMVRDELLAKIRDAANVAHERTSPRKRQSGKLFRARTGTRSVTENQKIIRSVVRGVGGYLPACVSQMTTSQARRHQRRMDQQRTASRSGISRGRRNNLDAGREAARAALANAGLTPSDIDLVIVATSTPDYTFRPRQRKSRRCWG